MNVATVKPSEIRCRGQRPHNSHHPEHYGNRGISGMDLFDVVEMMCDWMAAARRNPADGSGSTSMCGSSGLSRN
jgi:hypothetical protein